MGETGAKPGPKPCIRPDHLSQTQDAPKFPPTSEYDMTVLKPRSRMISVRLSEEEYTALRGLCSVMGARSVSDLTRDAMRTFVGVATRESAFSVSKEDWYAHLHRLDERIDQLAADISMLKTNLTN